MKESIKLLYRIGSLNKDGVKKAVEKKFITPEEYAEIVGEPYQEVIS